MLSLAQSPAPAAKETDPHHAKHHHHESGGAPPVDGEAGEGSKEPQLTYEQRNPVAVHVRSPKPDSPANLRNQAK